jgi:hypothetical protein
VLRWGSTSYDPVRCSGPSLLFAVKPNPDVTPAGASDSPAARSHPVTRARVQGPGPEVAVAGDAVPLDAVVRPLRRRGAHPRPAPRAGPASSPRPGGGGAAAAGGGGAAARGDRGAPEAPGRGRRGGARRGAGLLPRGGVVRGPRRGEHVPELPALVRRPRRHRHPPPRLQASAAKVVRVPPRPQGSLLPQTPTACTVPSSKSQLSVASSLACRDR